MTNYYLPYMYRDQDNYKQHASIELTAPLTDEQVQLITDTLDQSEYFIPEQVGAIALPYSKGGTDADHPWHELILDPDIEGVVYNDDPEDYNCGPFTPEELTSAFVKAAAVGWKDISDADAAKFAAAALIAKIAGYPTSEESLAKIDDDDTRLEIWQEIQGDSPDTLDALILEARKITDAK